MTPLWVDLGPQWRGGQNQALLALRGLRARGHLAELIALRGCPLARRAQAEGIPVHIVGGWAVRAQTALFLRRLLARSRFHLLHANEAHALTAAWLAGAHRRLPIVASRRVAYPLQNHPLALVRYRAARRILAVSHFVAETVIASGISPDHVEVVYDGVEVPPLPSPELRRLARERWGASEGVTLLGCVGYFLPEKGQQFLIRALPALREHNNSCRLLLAGDGPCRGRLERLVRQLGLESAVHFAGVVEDVSEVYAALDVFVLPSLAEPLGSSLLTAMAHGMPVVAAASGGVPEYIEHGRNGLLVEVQPKVEYARTLARALMRLLREPDTARRLGAAAREMIAARFTAERMVEETLRVYQEARAEGAWR